MQSPLVAVTDHLCENAPPHLRLEERTIHLGDSCAREPNATPIRAEDLVQQAQTERLHACEGCSQRQPWISRVTHLRTVCELLQRSAPHAPMDDRALLTPAWLRILTHDSAPTCCTHVPWHQDADFLGDHNRRLAALIHTELQARSALHGELDTLLAIERPAMRELPQAQQQRLASLHPLGLCGALDQGQGLVAFAVAAADAGELVASQAARVLDERYLDPLVWRLVERLLQPGIALPERDTSHAPSWPEAKQQIWAALPGALETAHAALR